MRGADDDERWMAKALEVAGAGLAAGELPIGAVVVVNGEAISTAFTQERSQRRLLVHAELLALNAADRKRPFGADRPVLYTTLEPCLMCLGAAAVAMVERVVFALASPGDGAAAMASWWDEHRGPELPHVRLPSVTGGQAANEAAALFRQFCNSRPGATDPLTTWARSLTGDPPPVSEPTAGSSSERP